MDHQLLDALLAQRQNALPPALPAGFRQSVWREIRLRQARKGSRPDACFEWLLEPLFRPGAALGALSLALVVGICLGAAEPPVSRDMQTRVALDLQVFGPSSASLPDALLGYSR